MMAQFSPLSRRIVAIGIAVLALLGLINLVIVPLYGLTAGSLSDLEDARFQRARLEAIAARPPLPRSEPVPASLYVAAPDRQRASDALIAAIGGTAAGYEIQLDSVTPTDADPARPEAIGVRFTARGEQDKILAWINDLESGSPAAYFTDWSLGPGTDGAAMSAPAATAVPPAASEEGAPTPPPPPPAASPSGQIRLLFTGTATAIWKRPS